MSFTLPAFYLDIETFFGWRVDIHEMVSGGEAAWFAIAHIVYVFEDWEAWIWVFHGASNILILLSPIAVLKKTPEQWRWLAHGLLAATIYNAMLLPRLEGGASAGYYLWLASFAVVSICMYTRQEAVRQSKSIVKPPHAPDGVRHAQHGLTSGFARRR